MENRKLLRFLLVFGLVGGLVLRLLYASHLPLSNDEGSYLYDGLLLSQGKWPFLTSFSRAPALMFLTALVVKIFGRSFLAGRMISILAGLGSAYFLYLIGRKLFNQRVGIVAFLLYALLAPCVVHTIYLHTQPVELFLALVGVYFVLEVIFDHKVKTPKFSIFNFQFSILAGIFFGLAVLVRETAALYPAAMVLAIFALRDGKNGTCLPAGRTVSHLRLREAVLMGVSSLAVWGGIWGFVVSQVGFKKVKAVFLAITTMHDTGEYMSFGFTLKKKFEVFYGAFGENFILYFLAVVFAVIVVKRVVRQRQIEKNWAFLLILCSVPFLFYGLYYRRLQAEYLAEFMPALVLMSAVALDKCSSGLQSALKTRSELRYHTLFLLLPIAYCLFTNYRYQWHNQHGGTFAPEALKEAVSYVKKNIPPDEEIFTGAVIIPFLSGHELSFNISRPVIFGYPHLKPEIKYTLFPQDHEIINHLEARPVEWAVFDRTTWETFSRGHPELEDYLKNNYNIVKTIPNKRTGTVL